MRKLLTILTLLSLAPFVTFAADSTVTQGENVMNLSLKDATDYALEHNRTIKNASLSIRQAEMERWASIANMLPQVNATLDYSNMMGYKMSLGPMDVAMPAYGSLGVNVAMAVSGAQIVGTQISKISEKMAEISSAMSEQEVVEQVKLLYFSALVSGQSIELLKKNMETIEKLYSFSMKSVEAGVSEKVDADQIKVQVATIKTAINSAERSLEMVYNALRLQLSLDFDVELNLTDTMTDLLDVEKCLQIIYDDFVLENNYSYQLALKNVELSKKQKSLAGWAYGPSLSAFYQYSGRKYFTDEMTMNMTPPNMIGITLSVPIFSSGSRYGKFQSAKIEYQKQQNSLEDTEMALKIQHRQLKYNLTSAYETFDTQQQNVDVSQSVFDNISKKYEAGMSSSLDVTTAANTLITAQNSYIMAALDYMTAYIELEKLLNKGYNE